VERSARTTGTLSAIEGRSVDRLKSFVSEFLPDSVLCRAAAVIHLRFEPELWTLVHRCDPDGVAIDVGAWLGPWSYWLARRVEQVVAFEPNPDLARILTEQLPSNVEVHQVAVAESAGTAQLAVSGAGRGREGQSTLGELAGARTILDVRTAPLDSFDFERVRFLKVDVEGQELGVLAGARDLLERWHPVVVAELEDRHGDVGDAMKLMESLGYQGWAMVEHVWRPIDADRLVALQRAALAREPARSYIGTAVFRSGHYINNVVFTHPRSSWLP
jgi:FkbM family methyltransferase